MAGKNVRFQAVMLAFALSACAAQVSPPYDPASVRAYEAEQAEKAKAADRPLTLQEWCAGAAAALGRPGTDQFTNAALLEKMRNRGCLR